MSKTLFITTASWEPRFELGAGEVLRTHAPSAVICFWFEEYAERTAAVRARFGDLVQARPLKWVELPWTARMVGNRMVPAHAIIWRRIYEAIEAEAPQYDNFVFDISTTPRECIWIILDLLTERRLKGAILYHQAEEHGEWCGSEPGQAHIVPKLGGIPLPEARTKLLIVAGYDQDRSEQFIKCYEPAETLILCQKGVHTENITKNIGRHKERFGGKAPSVSIREVDCYVADWGFQELFEAATSFGMDSNLLMASLGPKLSAVSLYRVHRRIEQSSLVYASCRDYNEDYSSGLKETMSLGWGI